MTTFTEFIQNISTHLETVASSNKIAPFYDSAKSYKAEDLKEHITAHSTPYFGAVAAMEVYQATERSHLMKQMRPRHYYAFHKNSLPGRLADLKEVDTLLKQAPVAI